MSGIRTWKTSTRRLTPKIRPERSSNDASADAVRVSDSLESNLDFLNAMSTTLQPLGVLHNGDEKSEVVDESDLHPVLDLVTRGHQGRRRTMQFQAGSNEPETIPCSPSEMNQDDPLVSAFVRRTPSPSSPMLSIRKYGEVSANGNDTSHTTDELPLSEAAESSDIDIHPATFESNGDDVPPIRYFGTIINDGNDDDDDDADDDTISQITSSINSQSVYDSSSFFNGGSSSRNSGGSFFRKASKSPRNQRSVMSGGETSYADTLDEIADMLHPNQSPPGQTVSRPRPFIPVDDIPIVELHPSRQKNDTLFSSFLHHPTVTQLLASLEPTLAKTRLLLRYLQSRVVPPHWKTRKNDGEDEDYYDMYMKSSPLSSKIPRAQRRQRLFFTALALVGIFCGMTLLLLMLRLTMMHAMQRIPNSNNRKSKASVSSKIIHGGMSIRGGRRRHSFQDAGSAPQEEDPPVAFSHFEHVGIDLPSVFDNLGDVDDFQMQKGIDIPFFWHIPRTGGGTMNDIVGACLSLTMASDAGGAGEAGQSNNLQVVTYSKRFSYVNVDTSTAAGIDRARRLNLAGSGLADLVVTTLLHEGASLFTPLNKGRMFTIFRHPIERAVSLFHYVQDTQWRRRQTFQKDLSELTMEEYFKGGLAENNWMTRFLVNELTKGELTRDDVNLAKEILRRKCLVGLLKEKGESLARFERYFGWQLKSDEEKECHDKKLQWAWPLKHRHDEVEEGTPLWDLIMAHNIYDMELYEYAQLLFHEQSKIFL